MKKKPPAARQTHVRKPHEVVQEALLLAGRQGGPDEQLQAHERVAQALGISASMLYKWRQPAERGSGSPNPLERTAQLIAATGDTRIVDWLAHRAGGHFVRDEGNGAPAELPRASNALVREFGLLIAEVVDAAADQRITPEESQRLRDKWSLLRRRTEDFVRRCEQGDYDRNA
jgi:transposase-like protein